MGVRPIDLGGGLGIPYNETENPESYHPDRYAQADLPNEVREYLAAMARKINAAFAALETADKARNKRAPSDRVVAVHTSGTRF